MLSKTESTQPVFWISLGIQQWGKIIVDATELVFPIPYTGLNYIVLATSSAYQGVGGVNWIAVPVDKTKVKLSRTYSNSPYNFDGWPKECSPCWFSLGY